MIPAAKHGATLLIAVFLFVTVIPVFGTDDPATGSDDRPHREHITYFENTANELNVYRLFGRFDGNTALILGGIQGDEPGGFLSADLYPNLVLERGNLIVIPRANFQSIIHFSRGMNGDMNRKFDHDKPRSIEDQIVEIIKELMEESDLFLNLHDGWGYYRDTYIDEQHNPDRFGQSIIADCAEYVVSDDTLYLEEMARTVIRAMNRKIQEEEHKFHFMNTRTLNEQTNFPEQRKSATYFALTSLGIPAFGVESSKNLPSLEKKIRYHNYAINEFLKLMQIEPEHPSVLFEPPRLIYLLVSVNNGNSQLVEDGQELHVGAGDLVRVTHIESNYPRGLSCDISGVGSENDFQQVLRVYRSTEVISRKDNDIIGKISLKVDEIDYENMAFVLEVNGERQSLLPGQTLSLRASDRFKIVDVVYGNAPGSTFSVNLKGYVPPTDFNTGEDRNYLITAGNINWKKYSVDGQGKTYPIVVTKGNREVSRMFISIE